MLACHADDATSTEAMTAFSEISHESKSTLRQRIRGTHENSDKLKGLHSDARRTVSISISRANVVLLAILFVMCVVISRYLST